MSNLLALGGGMIIAVLGTELNDWDSLGATIVFCLIVIMIKQIGRD